jgi:hypothetical protein
MCSGDIRFYLSLYYRLINKRKCSRKRKRHLEGNQLKTNRRKERR